METSIVAVYENLSVAYFVVLNLTQRGFQRSAISLVAEDIRDRPGDPESVQSLHRARTSMPEWADYGVLTESIAGILGEITTVSLIGVGPVIAGGPVVRVLKTHGVESRGLSAPLKQLNLTEDEAGSISNVIQQGKVLVAVQIDAALVERAKSTMKAFAPIWIVYRDNTPDTSINELENTPSSLPDSPTSRRVVDPDDTKPSKSQLTKGRALIR